MTYTFGMDAPQPSWRALFSSDDPDRVRAVATTIASMGFEVRCSNESHPSRALDGDDIEHQPREVCVREEDFPELIEVLDEIIAEQAEFDQQLKERRWRVQKRIALALVIAAMLALALLGLLQT